MRGVRWGEVYPGWEGCTRGGRGGVVPNQYIGIARAQPVVLPGPNQYWPQVYWSQVYWPQDTGLRFILASGSYWPQVITGLRLLLASGITGLRYYWPQAYTGLRLILASGYYWPQAITGLRLLLSYISVISQYFSVFPVLTPERCFLAKRQYPGLTI